MSFDFMLQRVRDGVFAPFKRSIVAEIVGPNGEYHNGEILGAYFSDQDRGDIWGTDEDEIANMSFSGGGEKFMQMVWEIADRTQSYIFWVEGDEHSSHLVATSEEASALIPPSVVKDIGPAIIVRDGQELSKAIYANLAQDNRS